MNEKKILSENIYLNSSLLIKEYLKLTKEQNSFPLGNEILNIYLKISSLNTKNEQEIKFKNYCMNFLKGNIESKLQNIFNDINCKPLNNNNLNKNEIIEISHYEKNTKKLIDI